MNNVLPRPVGFEIEFCGPARRSLARLHHDLEAAGYKATNYGSWRRTEANNDYWDLKTDSSCGCEAASPVIRTKSDLVHHAAVVNLVKQAGKIDETCGLHVHIQASDLPPESLDRVMRFLTRYQEAIFLTAPVHRRKNRWCKSMETSHMMAIRAAAGTSRGLVTAFPDKNTWVNAQPLGRIGTVEFRLMGGNITPEYVVGWVSMIQQIFLKTAVGTKRVAWGKAKAKDNRMLLYTMLQQAGCYGKDLPDKDLAIAARAWAIEQFNLLNPAQSVQVAD